MDSLPRVVLVTAPDVGVASRLARGMVDARIAACVNVVEDLLSVFRWEGAVEEASEVLMIVKTTAARFAELNEYLQREHPYDVPECIALEPAAVEGAYLEWWRSACKTTGPTA